MLSPAWFTKKTVKRPHDNDDCCPVLFKKPTEKATVMTELVGNQVRKGPYTWERLHQTLFWFRAMREVLDDVHTLPLSVSGLYAYTPMVGSVPDNLPGILDERLTRVICVQAVERQDGCSTLHFLVTLYV